MVRRLTADISGQLEDVDISQFDFGEGPAGLKAEWRTGSGLEEAVEAVNQDEVFPDYELPEVRSGEAEQVGVYEGDSFTDYSFNSSEYHFRVREYDVDWKRSEIEFIGLEGDSYSEDIAFYHERV